MRYCPYCHRLNAGRPQLCFYCGHTWHVRLCPRGHENPPDAQFCGSCGSADLTETAGPVPWWLWLIRISIIGLFVLLIASLGDIQFRLTEQQLTYVIAIFILLFAIHMALSQIPGPVRRIVQQMIRFLKKWSLATLIWLWERLKNLLG